MDPRSAGCTFRPSLHTHSCLVTHGPQAWAVTREQLREQNGTIGQSKVTRDNVTGLSSENAAIYASGKSWGNYLVESCHPPPSLWSLIGRLLAPAVDNASSLSSTDCTAVRSVTAGLICAALYTTAVGLLYC